MGKRQMIQRHLISWSKIRSLKTSSIMSSDHMKVTQSSSRKEVITPATVTEVKDISDSVKLFSFKILNKDFSFKAGQWVDTFVPGVDTVGGFSMCSAPALLKENSVLQLAIKFSRHPPAFWAHTQCKLGDTVMLRSGGDFYFDPVTAEQRGGDVMLVAGGVGINPLYSMVQHAADLNSSPTAPFTGNILLLYSARSMQELIFKDHLKEMSATHGNINVKFHVTRESPPQTGDFVSGSRINQNDIKKAVESLRADKLKIFMCGPSNMIHAIENYCWDASISKQQIYYERWW